MDKPPVLQTRFRVSPLAQAITEQFYTFDYRLRGYDLWQYPVHPEPTYALDMGVPLTHPPIEDDARRHTLLSSLVQLVKNQFQPATRAVPEIDIEEEADHSPDLYIPDGDLIELQIALPKDVEYNPALIDRFLGSLRGLRHLVAFELIGTNTHVLTQFACREVDIPLFESQFRAFFPQVVITKEPNHLLRAWQSDTEREVSVVDFGLGEECGLSLSGAGRGFAPDPLVSLVAAMEAVGDDECAILQILFTPTKNDWRKALLSAVTDSDGSSILSDAPELQKATLDKVQTPLFAVVLRAGAVSPRPRGALTLVQRLAGALGQFDAPGGNRLIPLTNEFYPDEIHADDLLLRITHRSGMLLSTPELISLVHLPTPMVASPKLLRANARSKECPRLVRGHQFVLGTNPHQGEERMVSLSKEQRLRHTYIVGASGTGKSTLLQNLIRQDIEHGEGFALLDPHGDLLDSVLHQIPASRRDDVIVFDPGDQEFPIGFNIFHAHSEEERILLASDLTMTFQRLSTSWGDRMNAILANGILAMLEHPKGGTLLTLRRFLTDKSYRRQYLADITEPEVRHYWEKEFPLLSGRVEAPVLTRLDTFLRTKTIRNMVAQTKNSIDFSKVMDEKKILLLKLSHGAIGEENAHLLGTLIVTAIHQAALRRQGKDKEKRSPFYLYIDEFQNFITPSMEAILSGARKYNLGLVLAHQERRQLVSKDREVASSALSNSYTRICFRLGYDDASTLAKGLSYFDSSDLQNLGIGQAIARTEQAQYDFNLAVPWVAADESGAGSVKEIVSRSQSVYGAPIVEVESLIHQFYQDQQSARSEPSGRSKDSAAKSTSDETVSISDQPVPRTPQKRIDGATARSSPAHNDIAPPLMGRGGPQHKYLQQLIKKVAEDCGYRATIEYQLPDGTGSVDVSIEDGNRKIACEVSITTPASHELANTRKCLTAGFNPVIIIASDTQHLRSLKSHISPKLTDTESQQVLFLLPNEFLAFLEQDRPANDSKKIRGYDVKVNYKPVDTEDQKSRREAIAKVIVQSMKRLDIH